MKSIQLDITKAEQFLSEGAVKTLEPQVKAAQLALENGTCPGNDFLGWLHLPTSITPEFLDEIQAVANTLRQKCEAVVVAGIGGSYLGARAVIEAMGNSFAWLVNDGKNPTILFAGNNIGEDYLAELTEYLKGKKFGVINISKSGTTTETALTFRLLKKQCEAQMGKEEAKNVIVAVTDAKKGAARTAQTRRATRALSSPTTWAVASPCSPPWACCPSLAPDTTSSSWWLEPKTWRRQRARKCHTSKTSPHSMPPCATRSIKKQARR